MCCRLVEHVPSYLHASIHPSPPSAQSDSGLAGLLKISLALVLNNSASPAFFWACVQTGFEQSPAHIWSSYIYTHAAASRKRRQTFTATTRWPENNEHQPDWRRTELASPLSRPWLNGHDYALISALGTELGWIIICAVLLFCLIGICLAGFVREQTGNKQIYGELCQGKGYA